MDKAEVKKLVKNAIETSPSKADIVSVALFGSFLRNEQKPRSDVDLLIDFKPRAEIGLFELLDIETHFKKALGRKVDLVTKRQLSPYFREEVFVEAEKIYGR